MHAKGAKIKIFHAHPRAARLPFFACTFAAFLFSAQTFVRAQDASPEADETIRVDTDLVTVPVVVTDGRGRRALGLTRDDFNVFDESRAVEISYFATGAERVGLLFLLDSSGSARESLREQREAALALFSRFGRGSRVSVLSFQERTVFHSPFTSDADEARAAFVFVAQPDRGTAIFDAALEAVRAYSSSDATERRIVILISDGLDNASRTRTKFVIEEASRANVSFYVVHTPLFAPLNGRLAPRPPAKGVRDLAEKTGGRLFTLGDLSDAFTPRPQYDFQPIFQAIEADLRGQYVLGYYADSQGGARADDGDRSSGKRMDDLRRIEVRLKKRVGGKLRVRALRESYFLQSPRANGERRR